MSLVLLMTKYHSIFKDEMAEMHKISIVFLTVILLLTGCGDPVEDQINAQIPVTERQVMALGQKLLAEEIPNAQRIKTYADTLAEQNPQFAPLVNELRKDGTQEGPLYLALVSRFETAKNQAHLFTNPQERFDELLNIQQAADPTLFSDALSDPLNVLADISNGKLDRVNALSKAQSMAANGAEDFGVGEQLIGNPAYGNWQTQSNGTSFWMWYGLYRIFDDVVDFGRKKRGRVYYSRWGSSRNYSYYNDYGRTRYSSPSQLQKQNAVENRTRKSFESRGQKFNSAYSKNRTGASGVSNKSKTAQASANRFRNDTASKSKYAKSSKSKSTYSKSASFRNSSSSTSRSSRRGK
ncbi:hypothetical protein [Thalassotalea atypica]|uniref:hypothetical protein n=1 Tax=Thalassotalea atypica TaxID=2054316 RepID=UPI002573F523|nr:hypothetical protein [Thalassotalea atypica]